MDAMVNLALKSVLHAWRRYLPVAIAVGISGLMMVAQLSLALGAFQLAAAPVEWSRGALWVGPAKTEAVDQSSGLSPFAASRLWLDPDVARIEPWRAGGYGSIAREDAAGNEPGNQANIFGIDVSENALNLSKTVPLAMRQALSEPGTVLLGQADAKRLGVGTGDRIKLNNQPVRVVGIVADLRAMFGMFVVTSEATLRTLGNMGMGSGSAPSFYILDLKPGADAEKVKERLMAGSPAPEYRVWTARELADSTIRAWAFGSGAGTLFLTSAGIALVVTLMVVNQTLGAAVAGSLQEYAALRAYGIAFRSLQGIVMRQGIYVSAGALVLTAVASAGLLMAFRLKNITARLPLEMTVLLAAVLTAVVMLSNLMAVRRLRRADPAALLR